MEQTLICTFTSRINNVAPGIVYELHEWNETHYLIKWRINEHVTKEKQTKKSVDAYFRDGQYVKEQN